MHRLIASAAFAAIVASTPLDGSAARVPYGPHVVYGIIREIHPNALVVQMHSGALVRFDITIARDAERTGVLYVNRAVALHGDYDGKRVYHVNAISSANGIRFGAPWPQDQ